LICLTYSFLSTNHLENKQDSPISVFLQDAESSEKVENFSKQSFEELSFDLDKVKKVSKKTFRNFY